jgi:plastocyanin
MMMTPQQMQQMMNNPKQMTQWHQTMMNNPQAMNNWMNTMTNNPQMMNQWMGNMMNDPQFMNHMMGTMMNDPNFQQQYMGPWMMMRDPQFMQHMSAQWYRGTNLEDLVVQTNKVSILANTWQYQSTKAFSPSVINVSLGTIVTWTNEDTVLHTVTDFGGSFDSGFIQAGETWDHEFNTKNTYNYFCSIHPWMRGTVIVS